MKIHHIRLLVNAMALILGMCASLHAGLPVAETWREFLAQTKAGDTPNLPDFSYAGYKRGGASITATGDVFDVCDYGAVADDLQDDLRAIKRATFAAKDNGGGIVQFPAGRFLVNTDLADRGAVPIDSDNIVLRGSGCGTGGTIIHLIQPYGGGNPHDKRRLHLGRNLLYFFSRPEFSRPKERPVLCKVVGDVPRERFVVGVDTPGALSIGDHVILYSGNSEILRKMTKPYDIEPAWTRIAEGTSDVVEIHNIAAIEGNRVTFAEPIRYDVTAADGWDLRPYNPISGVGVEDICFMGNAYHAYKHHRSGYDDSGWAFIKMRGVTDSWIRRCTFINASQVIAVTLSSYVSVLNIRVEGNKGHHIPRVYFFNYGVLNGLITDNAAFDHGPSVSLGSVGTVFWRTRGQSSVDCHSGTPYVTLFDRVAAGGFNSSGGVRDYPQHLRHMVMWNFENLETGAPVYDFWRPGKNNRFVKPTIVGLTGEPISFTDGSLAKLESPGNETAPASLYEAQLTRRLGARPAWLDDALRDAKTMADIALPEFYRRDGTGTPFLCPQTFKVADMLQYVTSLSLQMFHSKQFTYELRQVDIELTTDRGFVRNTIYSLMTAIYDVNKDGNTVTAHRDDATGDTVFTIRAGKPGGTIAPAAPAVTDAVAYAQVIGATVTSEDTPHLTFTVRVPGK